MEVHECLEASPSLLSFHQILQRARFTKRSLCTCPLKAPRPLSPGPIGKTLVMLIQPVSDVAGNTNVEASLGVLEHIDAVAGVGLDRIHARP